MSKRAIILHGWKGVPEGAWRPWLKKELEEKGFEVRVPQMPNADNPEVDKWVTHISSVVGTPNKNTYLVGHSLGCIASLRYIESLEAGQQVGGAVLVAGSVDDLGHKELSNFFSKPIDWGKIKSICKKIIAINSDNDDHVPLMHADVFKNRLGAKVIIKHGMKHFCGKDGITELPVALESVLKISCNSLERPH